MGLYYEPRPPSGSPTDGERDVWLEGGKVRFGHYVAASSSWVVDKEIDYNGITGADTLDGYHATSFESSIGEKGTAFNKNFAGTGSATTVAKSDHTHGGTFSGDADTIDGHHYLDIMQEANMVGEWHIVGASGEPAYENGWTANPGARFRVNGGYLELSGTVSHDPVSSNKVFTLPAGFRPFCTSKAIRDESDVSCGFIDSDGSVRPNSLVNTIYFDNWQSVARV